MEGGSLGLILGTLTHVHEGAVRKTMDRDLHCSFFLGGVGR
jgi:hypothetical protein